MTQQSFIRMQEMADEIREVLGDVVVAVSGNAVHVDPGAAVHAIVGKLKALDDAIMVLVDATREASDNA